MKEKIGQGNYIKSSIRKYTWNMLENRGKKMENRVSVYLCLTCVPEIEQREQRGVTYYCPEIKKAQTKT
jgi:hypothetical protein